MQVTGPEAGARELGRAVVDRRLAACVSVLPGVTSNDIREGRRRPYTAVPEVLAPRVRAGASDYLRRVRDSVSVEGR